jgi:hypothetical protein
MRALGEAQKEALEDAADLCLDERDSWNARVHQSLNVSSEVLVGRAIEADSLRAMILALRGEPSEWSEVKVVAEPGFVPNTPIPKSKNRSMDLE